MTKNKTKPLNEKSSTKRKKPLVSTIKGIISFFRDERFLVSLGFFLLAFALILCLSFTSYLFTWQTDQSILSMGIKGLFSNNSFQVENWMGKLGAVLSNKFIHDWFGLASYIFVLSFGVFNFKPTKVIWILLIKCKTNKSLEIFIYKSYYNNLD
jgi:S-DNA-T family DNA segregation ATPase FtsK/SpoIIIE